MRGYSTPSSRLRHAKPSFSETRREASFPSKYFKMIVSTPSSFARSMMAFPAYVAYPLPQSGAPIQYPMSATVASGESVSMRSAIEPTISPVDANVTA